MLLFQANLCFLPERLMYTKVHGAICADPSPAPLKTTRPWAVPTSIVLIHFLSFQNEGIILLFVNGKESAFRKKENATMTFVLLHAFFDITANGFRPNVAPHGSKYAIGTNVLLRSRSEF